MSIYKQENGQTYNLAGPGDISMEIYKLQKEKASTKTAMCYNSSSSGTSVWFKMAEINCSNDYGNYMYMLSFDELFYKYSSGIAYISLRLEKDSGITLSSSGTFFKWLCRTNDEWDNRAFALTIDNSNIENPKAYIWVNVNVRYNGYHMKLLSYHTKTVGETEEQKAYNSLETYMRTSGEASLPQDQTIIYSKPFEDISVNMSLYNRNNIYRGKDLTDIYTWDDISSKVRNGTFDDLYVGDYINVTIDNKSIPFRFAGFDTYLGTGDTQLTSHHIVIVPDIIKNAQMNLTSVITGGFKGSAIWTTVIPEYNTKVENAIGANHVLSYRQLISNSVNSSGQSSGWEWVTAKLFLMSEVSVYGSTVFSSSGFDIGIDNRQFPIFRLNPSMYNNERTWWWLKAVRSATYFCFVANFGFSSITSASDSGGFRPFFLMH